MAAPLESDDLPELLDPELSELAQALRAEPDWRPDEAWHNKTKERLLRAYDQHFAD